MCCYCFGRHGFDGNSSADGPHGRSACGKHYSADGGSLGVLPFAWCGAQRIQAESFSLFCVLFCRSYFGHLIKHTPDCTVGKKKSQQVALDLPISAKTDVQTAPQTDTKVRSSGHSQYAIIEWFSHFLFQNLLAFDAACGHA